MGADTDVLKRKTKVILLVGEDPTVGEAIARAFRHHAVTFHFAFDIKAAKLILADHAHELDLVVSHVGPKGHALGLLRTIKTCRDLPILVLGSKKNLAANAKVLSAGPCKVIRMPIDSKKLREKIVSLGTLEIRQLVCERIAS